MIAGCGAALERGTIAHSYACRAGRGQHAALRQTKEWIRRRDWFLKLDVAKYYDSIPHDLLRERLARRFRERRLLSLLGALLESHHHTPGRGLPIGALTSQYLGNFYLDVFDHWVNQQQKLPRYLRYMDDLLFLADDSALRALLPDAVALLDGLGLRVKGGGVRNRCEMGVPFLGFVLYPDRTRLNRAGRRRVRRKMKTIEKAFSRGAIRELELQARASSLFAHASFGNDVAWRRMAASFTRIGDALEPESRPARWVMEQHGEELPLRWQRGSRKKLRSLRAR
jgi:RNA-directed DNA polymerase